MSEVRIGHVLNTMGHGGVPRVAHELLQALPSSCERVLYCLSARSRDVDDRDAQVRRLQAAGVRVRFADADGAQAAGEQVGRWAAEDGLHVLHTHSTKPNRWARAAAARHADARLVAHYHNTYDDKWCDAQALAHERELAAATDRFVAVSGAVRDHVVERLRLPPERVVVVPNGVSADRLQGDRRRLRAELQVRDDVPLVGTVGRLSAQKAPEDFLRAARVVLDAEPRAVFVLVGEADEPQRATSLRALAGELGLGRLGPGDPVRWLGHRADVADVYAALDVFVLPSRWEGFGLVLVEAMTAGTPVVATDVGGVPEVVGAGTAEGSCALLVPAGRPDALAVAVRRLLSEPATAQRLRARGRLRAAQFGWRRTADAVQALYAELLPRPAGAA